MQLEGICYCGEVAFTVFSHTPYPYMRCYCSLCRKTAGSGGYGINIMAEADSLTVRGEQHLAFHCGFEHDPLNDKLIKNDNRRYFCNRCGSTLWAADPRWQQWIYPYASSIEVDLPKPPEVVHIMLDFAVPWVDIPSGEGHRHFRRYPDESIEQWHRRHGLFQSH